MTRGKKSNLYHLLFEELAEGNLFKNQSHLVREIYTFNKETYSNELSMKGYVNQVFTGHRKCSSKLRSAIEKVLLNNLGVLNLSEEKLKLLIDSAIQKDNEAVSTWIKYPFGGNLSEEQPKGKIGTEQALNLLYQTYICKINEIYESRDNKGKLGFLGKLEELISGYSEGKNK